MDYALETFMMSCGLVRQQNIFRKLFGFFWCVVFFVVFLKFLYFWGDEAELPGMLWMPVGIIGNIGTLLPSTNKFYALNKPELGLRYSWYFPRENTNCLVQQWSVPLEFQSKWLARSVFLFLCPGLRQMLGLLFCNVHISQCSSRHLTVIFRAWRKKIPLILCRLLSLLN